MEEGRDTRPITDPYTAKYYSTDAPTLPDAYEPIPLPPPPPKEPVRVRLSHVIILVSIFALVFLFGAGFLVVYASQNGFSVKPGATPNATPVVSVSPTLAATQPPPTPTPTPYIPPTSMPTNGPAMEYGSAPYNADMVAGAFYRAGLAPYTTTIDANWKCCSYYPAGGASFWPDQQNGENMDIATFSSVADEDIDAKQLTDEGFNDYVVGYCLLSYNSSPPDLSSYLTVMEQVCTG